MATSPAIVADDLWERFTIQENRAHHIKEVVSRFRFSRGKKEFWALKGVTFQVPRGQTVGLIGENGSGKSTLLRCIAGIYRPSRGMVLVGGSVSSLIELGAGFHGELTGRENVLLNGSLFGLTRRQIKERFDSIVEFSEIEEFLDQPVRAYSSGMSMRLAFSLSVHVDPTILLIDEVLAVGDEAFQRKCIRKVIELGASGTTIVFVSHDLNLVREICERTILLHHGELLDDGGTAEVLEKYLRLEHEKSGG